MNINDVGNASLGASMGTTVLTVVTDHATAISVLSTLCFGIVYVACAVWNAYSNHKRNSVSERVIVDSIIKRMRSDNVPDDLIQMVIQYKRK